MRGLPFVDAHVHLWDLKRIHYPWLTPPFGDDGPNGSVAPIATDYRLDDYLAEAAGWNVAGIVHVDAGADPAPGARRDRLAAGHGRRQRHAERDHRLRRARRSRGGDACSPPTPARANVRGIRHIVNWHADPNRSYTPRDVTGDAAWARGFGLLSKYGLSFDLQAYPGQFAGLAALIERHPETPVIVNHAGMGDRRRGRLARGHGGAGAAPQRRGEALGPGLRLSPVARRGGAKSRAARPSTCSAPERCMLASDFPTDRLFAPFDDDHGRARRGGRRLHRERAPRAASPATPIASTGSAWTSEERMTMMPNPLLGVFFHWLGGLASASFYVPYRGVRKWSWEIYWLTGGLFSWLIAPWAIAAAPGPRISAACSAPRRRRALVWPIFFGMLWGFGGLTYGLTMRYLGLSLGMAVVLGLCTVFGTLIPPIFQGDFASKLLDTTSGNIVLLGLIVTLAGIVVVARAGCAQGPGADAGAEGGGGRRVRYRKGILVAIFSGIMSSCFAFGLAAGEPIKAISAAAGTGPLWAGLPILCLVMLGGLVTNSIWCAILIVRNGSAGQWVGGGAGRGRAARSANFLLCAIAGTAWYFQFFFYTMGESQMGRFGFSSWTLHMASIIIFGTIWGFAFREWKDAAPKLKAMVWGGVGLLVFAPSSSATATAWRPEDAEARRSSSLPCSPRRGAARGAGAGDLRQPDPLCRLFGPGRDPRRRATITWSPRASTSRPAFRCCTRATSSTGRSSAMSCRGCRSASLTTCRGRTP